VKTNADSKTRQKLFPAMSSNKLRSQLQGRHVILCPAKLPKTFFISIRIAPPQKLP
jgi:hypothetical protein